MQYKHNEPTDKLNVINKVPIHFPKMKPPIRAIGVPKPSNITQKTVNKKKAKINKIKLLLFRELRLSTLFLIICRLLKSSKLNLENKKYKNNESMNK